ncbi:MAG: sugar ABC transporter ATP-binding protein [Christensenella sp.]|uniref:sugar ABC transporter ATP-binding protein n=1 Tax=Christensenella sp. TaxID=1935934 RepID=UPI002B1FEB16|nr:sugar ABC transporter ATP-binding protein [Christensenella sp.]MEA5002585.1 sugar ABC transporter ATP-binding protein [Christensenella sp.]
MSEYMLEMLGITMTFPGVKALDNVDLHIKKGEVHALIGENGAGKSTLMKVLSGVNKPVAGEVRIDGETVHFHVPQDAIDKGVAMIYQELSLVPDLTAIQNVMLGHEKQKYKFISKKQEEEQAGKWLDYVSHGTLPSYKIPVRRLSVAQQQMVDIAKALSYNAKIIVMDEPTDTLTEKEMYVLFDIIKKLKEDGITVIYISHRLEEIFAICDRITVLRDGAFIADANTAEVDKDWLISKMIGREMKNTFPQRNRCVQSETILSVKGLTGGIFENVDFDLKKGEILGFAGLVGSGRTEVMRAIFGADKVKSGEVVVGGKQVLYRHPSQAVKEGIGFATEDRKTQGLFLNLDIKTNVSAAAEEKVSSKGFVSDKTEAELATQYVKDLQIATPGIRQLCKNLSGGNQQKVVLAKWLARGCKILILDEPTRGIDVGAKYEIYTLMDKLVQEGVSIIMISSEMPEVIGMSDRIVVMHEGHVMGELSCSEANEERIMLLASGENG